LSDLKKSWLSVVPGGWRRGGEIRIYLTVQNRDGESDEYKLIAYSKKDIKGLEQLLKVKVSSKYEFENYVMRQGLGEIYGGY
jgi:hypothetical protein